MKDKAGEQLNEAYSRSVIVNASEIVIRPSVQGKEFKIHYPRYIYGSSVRASETILPLPAVLTSLSSTNLSTLMTTLRRDITSYYIDILLSQAAAVELSTIPSIAGVVEYKLSVFPAPPSGEILKTRVDNIATVLTFMNEHLFPHLPSKAAFPISLSRPLTHTLLDKLLKGSLPSSQQELPAFLELVQHTVQFENDFIHGVLGDTSGGQDVKTWADSVGSYYEKKRRVQLLERARAVIIQHDEGSSSFRAEISIVHDEPIPEDKHPSPAFSEPTAVSEPSTEDSNWGFDDEDMGDANGWGLDDDIDVDVPAEELEQTSSPQASPPHTTPEEAADDPWGLGDEDETADGDASTDSSAWDDPWGDTVEPAPAPAAPTKPTKTATRLEKLSNKGKMKDSGSALQSPVPPSPSPPKPAPPAPAAVQKRAPPPPKQQVEKESYLVSGRVKELLWLVEDALREASDLASSNILHSREDIAASPVGNVISQTSALILDLYRGLYPVAVATKLEAPKWAMGFFNDCTWLHGEVHRVLLLTGLNSTTKSKLTESCERLKLVGECWYDETIVSGYHEIYCLSAHRNCAYRPDKLINCMSFLTKHRASLAPPTKNGSTSVRRLSTKCSRVYEDSLNKPRFVYGSPELEQVLTSPFSPSWQKRNTTKLLELSSMRH